MKEASSVQKVDKSFQLDSEMINGLLSFKGLLDRKLVPGSSSSNDSDGQLNDDAFSEHVALQEAKAMTPPPWADNILSVAFTSSAIERKVEEISQEISRCYLGQEIVVVGLLTGAIVFMTDLIKKLKVSYTLDFIMCSSYGKGTVSKGSPIMIKDLKDDPKGKHILLVEDIIDTGRTLAWLKNYLSTKKCASVRVACLLDKKARRTEKHVHIDFPGFECPNEFVVGYGMDFAGHYRGLPFIGVLKPEAYEGV